MRNHKSSLAFVLLFLTIVSVNVQAQMIMSKASTLPTKPVGGNYASLQKWSNPTTWVGGKVPTSTNQAHIGANSAVLLDMDVDVNEIHVEGILVVDYSKDIKISTELLMAMNNGYFEWGVPNYRYTKNGLLVLKGNDLTKINENIHDYKSLMAESGGEVAIHGLERKSWTMLNATVLANKNAIVLSEPVDWRVGDEILITSTEMETTLKG